MNGLSSEPLVLIVYGANGFTGQLVATYLDAHPDLRGKPWAIAGRTQSKVAQLSAKLGDRTFRTHLRARRSRLPLDRGIN